MNSIPLHQKKLFAVIEAALAFLGLLLTWTVENNYINNGSANSNGFRSWGWLCLLGVIGVIVISFIGDKMQDYDKNAKMITMGCFAVIILGTILYLISLNSASNEQNRLLTRQYEQYGYQLQRGFEGYSAKSGPGLWTTMVAGVIGLAWVSGILDRFNTKPATTPATAPITPQTPTTPTTPTNP